MSSDDRITLDGVPSIPNTAITNVVDHPGRYANTDVGNAERFADRYGKAAHYCPAWSKWLSWDGRRWAIDDVVQVEAWAKDTAKEIVVTAKKLPEGQDGRDALIKHGLRSQASARIRATLELGRSEAGIPIRPDELDDDHYSLNLANGTLDLRTLQLRPHNPGDLLTKLCPVNYDGEAECYRWETFLTEVFEGDTALIEWLQRALGYSLTGDTSAQVFFLLYGNGENGKTTFLETIRALLGDYSQHAPKDTFIERRGAEGIPNDIARLMGARFVTAIETAENRRLDESLVKSMTGGDTITARFLRSEFFEFIPRFKVWFATNHKPNIKGTDHAIWRRIRLVPFNASFPPDSGRRDPHLGEKLQAELPGILNWCLSGLGRWTMGTTLDQAPDTVIQATAAYRSEEDVLGRFLEEATQPEPTGRVSMTDLYESYKTWCERSGERSETKVKLGRMLNERGVDMLKSHGTNWRLGIELLGPLETAPQPDDEPGTTITYEIMEQVGEQMRAHAGRHPSTEELQDELRRRGYTSPSE